MSRSGRRILAARIAAGALGVVAAGTAARAVHQRRVGEARRGAGDSTHFGTLRARPMTVVADDGVPLHVEVEEHDPSGGGGSGRDRAGPGLTLVFVHGFMLNQDCWHFQRAGYRGLVRSVFYDQRSHGRSGRSTGQFTSIEQLGDDLRRVIEQATPGGPVVLVGHSMGGMSIVALAERHPDFFVERVAGVGLISTTAGGLQPARLLLPLLPRGVSSQLGRHTIATLARGHKAVDGVRRIGKRVAMAFTDAFAFGSEVPPSYVAFVDEMLSATPFAVLADFFPHFDRLDKFHAVEALSRVPTTIVCGTGDKLTSVGHSRKLHAWIEGSRLVECDGAGHMVIIERHEQVNAALDQLIAAAAERVGR